MSGRVLVTYGTTHGSTAEVAAAVAATLVEQGLATVVLAARDVGNLGGLRRRRDRRRDLHGAGCTRRSGGCSGGCHRELAELPVAVFAMGPLTHGAKRRRPARARQLEHALGKAADVQPVATAVFGGVSKPDELRFPFNHMPEADARDWDAIDAWATEVGEAHALTRGSGR